MRLGTFSVNASVYKVNQPSKPARAALIADTGATFTTLPSWLLRELGVEPERTLKLRIADGSVVERGMGYAGLTLEAEGRSVPSTPVVFGDERVYLLGAVTLEELALAADPVHRKLVPLEGLLLPLVVS